MKRVSFCLTAAACWLAAAPLLASPLPEAKPEDVGLSTERLGRITTTLKADIDKGRIPGAVVAIARKGKLAYYEAFGYRDKAANAPMTKDAIFAIASMTKPMTSLGILVLYEENKLFVSDSIGKYFPALAKMPVAVMKKGADGQITVDTVPAKRPMTLQDLLRHTSGITYGGRGATPVHKMYPAGSASAGTSMTGAELIEKLGTLPLLHEPGTVWDYSLSVDVLGLVIEKVSGKPLGQFLDEKIWKPLGMTDTHFLVPESKVGRYAKALPNDPDSGRPQNVLDLTKPLKFDCGGGCAASTAADYIRFAQMLLNNGKLENTRIVSRKTVEFMTANHLGPGVQNNIAATDTARSAYGFGLGVAVRTDPGIAGIAGSTGDYNWGGAYGTYFWVDPKEELAVVFMSQQPGPIRLHYRQVMTTLALQAIND